MTKDIRYVGVYDREIDLFEGQYPAEDGITYNSYAIMDEKIAVMDAVDRRFAGQWLEHIGRALGGGRPDYLIVQHMEPDHSAGVTAFMEAYPGAVIVASAKAFAMMKTFFGEDYAARRIVVGEGDTLCLGRRELTFVAAPMIHWPEVIMTWDAHDRVFFSADAFGRFGAIGDGTDWAQEARRYYIGIVGKYGAQVQALLKKIEGLGIRAICPLHGPVIEDDLSRCLALYDTWSAYRSEESGVTIAYTSIYGNTKKAVSLLARMLRESGVPVAVHDLARCDQFSAVADAFRYDRLILAATTYNAGVFPSMRTFLHHLEERNFRSRRVGFVENGTWAPSAAKVMRGLLAPCRDLAFADTTVRIVSALSAESLAQLQALADEMKA